MGRFVGLVALIVFAGNVREAGADAITINHHYSFQEAVDELLSNGDPVDALFVKPGFYDESVVIDFAGTGQESLAIIRTTTPRPRVAGGIEVKNGRLVTFVGIEFDSPHGDGKAALRISDSHAVYVEDCAAVAGDDGGVGAIDSSEVRVSGGSFGKMTGDGVRIVGGTSHLVKNVKLKKNAGAGLWLEASHSTVKKIAATGNKDVGVHVAGPGNVIRNSAVESNTGIGIEASGSFTVVDNDVRENGGAGIVAGIVDGSPGLGGLIVSNDVSGNGGAGILVRKEHVGIDVSSNHVIGNVGAGIRVRSTDNRIADNTCRETIAGDGIALATTACDNCLADNFLADNEAEGVDVAGHDNLLITNRAKGDDGIVKSSGATGNRGRANKTADGKNHFP